MRGNHLIREIRKRAGLTQTELAERIGTTQSAIARIERHGSPTLARLSEIAEACGLDIHLRLVPADADDHDWSLVTGALARTPEQRFQSNRNAVRFAQSGRAAMAKETTRRKRVGT